MILTVNAHRPVKTLTGGSVGSQSPGVQGLTLTDNMSHGKWLWDGNPVALSTNLHLAPFQTCKINVCTPVGMRVPWVCLWRSEDNWPSHFSPTVWVLGIELMSPSLAASPLTAASLTFRVSTQPPTRKDTPNLSKKMSLISPWKSSQLT